MTYASRDHTVIIKTINSTKVTIMNPIYFLIITTLFGLNLVYGAEDLLDCAQCNGSGVVNCNGKCIDGKKLCPGPCIKKEVGPWVKMKVEGHGPDELWRTFTNPKGGTVSWSQAHIGEKVELKNGVYVNTGKCEKCNGTTRVECNKCKGSPVECPLCNGKKQVSRDKINQYKSQQSEKLNNEFPLIKLKSGQSINCKITARVKEKIFIKTPDGKSSEILLADIESGVNEK